MREADATGRVNVPSLSTLFLSAVTERNAFMFQIIFWRSTFLGRISFFLGVQPYIATRRGSDHLTRENDFVASTKHLIDKDSANQHHKKGFCYTN